MKNQVSQYKQMEKDILDAIGGSANVTSVTHCMTRLRFILKDNSLPRDDQVSKIDGVIGVNRSAGQYQVIIGQTVDKVYDAVCALGGFTKAKPINEDIDTQPIAKTTFSWRRLGATVMNKLAGSLTPMIPMLVAASMFKMFAAVLGPSMLHILTGSSDMYRLLTFVGDAGFYFFPIVIGYTAARQFNTSPIVAMFLGAIMVHPELIKIVTAGKPFLVFGIPMHLVNYSSTVIPIILSVWLMSYVEHTLKKYVPAALSTIFVPTLTIIIMLPLTLCVVGPAGGFLGTYICNGILAFGKLGGLPTILAIGVIGALWELLVMTGMHLVMITTMMMLIAQAGQDNFVTLGAAAASISVAGMCVGAALRLKDPKQKALAWSYLLASIVGGVTEPALYGIAVRYKRTFLGMMIGGFAGAIYAALTHVAAYVVVPVANFLCLTAYVHSDVGNLINGIISGVIAFVVAAIATYIIGVEKKPHKASKQALVHDAKTVEG